MSMDTEVDRMEGLLPFYANGTLPEAERARVEAWLQASPEGRAELQWYRSLQARLREDVTAVASSEETGLERALRRIRTEGPAPQGARCTAAAAQTSSSGERLRGWLASLVPQPVLRPALAVAVAVVAVQAAVIGQMSRGGAEATSELRALRASAAEQGPYLKLNFKADAREVDIRLLLVRLQGSLAAGPRQLGDYYVRVPARALAEAEQAARASGIVEGVAVVDGLPPRE
jgi:hypothetical protein